MLPIPRCILVESVSHLTFPESRTVFWSNPVSHLTFPESRTVFCLNRGSREDPSRPGQYDVSLKFEISQSPRFQLRMLYAAFSAQWQ